MGIPSIGKPRAGIIDLDGTLCNVSYKEDFDHESFLDRVSFDKINQWCLSLLEEMRACNVEIILLTARTFSSQVRKDTEMWLIQNEIPHDLLIGKSPNSELSSPEYKRKVLHTHLSGYNILFATDDNIDVCNMWLSENIPCHYCK